MIVERMDVFSQVRDNTVSEFPKGLSLSHF